MLLSTKLEIPDIANTRDTSGEKLERSIWSFRHFVLGVMAIFFYVGTEVAIGANLNLYAFELEALGVRLAFLEKLISSLVIWILEFMPCSPRCIGAGLW